MTQNFQQGVPSTPNVPIVDKEGNLNLSWYSFFVSLWNRTGGASGSVSGILDGISNVVGSLLYRGQTAWQGLDPGAKFKLLRMGDNFPAWDLIDGHSFSEQPKNEFLAGPSETANATPTFRLLATSDLDSLNGQIPGTTGADDADAGNIGEYIFAQVASGAAVSLVTGVVKDVTSISLTPGDWDIWANASVTAAPTAASAWISATTATDPGPPNSGAYVQWQTILSQPVGMMRVSLSGTATLYLSISATFGATNKAYGFLGARRRR